MRERPCRKALRNGVSAGWELVLPTLKASGFEPRQNASLAAGAGVILTALA